MLWRRFPCRFPLQLWWMRHLSGSALAWMYWLQGILGRKSRMMQILPSHMDCYWPLELVLCSIFCHYWLWNPIFGHSPIMKKFISWVLPIWAYVRSCKFPTWCISQSRRWYRLLGTWLLLCGSRLQEWSLILYLTHSWFLVLVFFQLWESVALRWLLLRAIFYPWFWHLPCCWAKSKKCG